MRAREPLRILYLPIAVFNHTILLQENIFYKAPNKFMHSVELLSPRNIGRISAFARWGDGIIHDFTWSPDGSVLALATSIGIHFYDAHTFQLVREMSTGAQVHHVAFSPDGTVLLSISRATQLWRVADGALLHTFYLNLPELPDEKVPFPLVDAVFSPDGSLIASQSESWQHNMVHLWQVSTGELLRSLEGHTGWIQAIAFSPDGTLLASVGQQAVRVWNVADGMPWVTLGCDSETSDIAFSPDGKLLASTAGHTIQLWQVSNWSPLLKIESPDRSMNSVAFSPDGILLASGARDGAIRVWRVSDGTLLYTLTGHALIVGRIAFSPDRERLASVAVDRQVLVWQVADGTLLHRLDGHSREIERVIFSPDGTILAAAGYNHVHARRVADGALLTEMEKWLGAEVAFISGELTLAFSKNNDVQLWRVSVGMRINNFPNAGTRAVISPSGNWLVSAHNSVVYLWRIADESLWCSLKGHTHDVVWMVFSPDEQILATAALDMTVKLWQVADGTLLETLEEGIGAVRSGMAFSPDRKLLAIGSAGTDTLRLWSVSGGTLLHRLKEPDGSIVSVAFSPDGGLLAVGTGDGLVHIWDAVVVKQLSTLKGHTAMVSSVAFSPDGNLLASGSLDGTVRLWGVSY